MVQEVWPAVAVNVPLAQSAHTRSVEAVGAAVWYLPAGQADRTAAHAAPSSAALNVVPELHAAQVRSAVAVPAPSCPWPTAQVAQSVQVSVAVVLLLALVLKLSSSQAAHARSLEVVAPVWLYPAAHTALVAPHASPESASLKVVPSVHVAHWRSELDVGATLSPSPAGQVACAAQLSVASTPELAPALKVSEAQSKHVRSLEVVAAAFVYLPATHAALVVAHAAPTTAVA